MDDIQDLLKVIAGLGVFILTLQGVNSQFVQRKDQIRCRVPKEGKMVQTTYILIPSLTSYRAECEVWTDYAMDHAIVPPPVGQDKCRELIMNDQVKGECEVLKKG